MIHSISLFFYSHPRLQFKNADERVRLFIEKRAKALNFEFNFFNDKAEALAAIQKSQPQTSHFALCSAMNPWIDNELLNAAAELKFSDNYCVVTEGAIPGSQFDFLAKSKSYQDVANLKPLTLRSHKQEKYNNQLNLFKYKRLKIFLSLMNQHPELIPLPLDSVMEKFSTPEIGNEIANYFTAGEKISYTSCPHCKSTLNALYPANSQPLIGHLPSTYAGYHRCQGCGLILLNPTLNSDSLPGIYDEFDSQDFKVSHTNPEAFSPNKVRMDFSDFIQQLPANTSSLDIGGGMGHFSYHLKKSHPSWTITHSDFESKRNEHLESAGVKTKELNFVKNKIGANEYDLITAWEVVEHLLYPDFCKVMDKIFEALKPGGFFVFSTPDFDSAICKIFDFYNVAIPFHTLVFSKSWLENYFQNHSKFKIHSIRHCSDFIDDWEMWSQYMRQTNANFQSKAMVDILDTLFKSNFGEKIKEELRAKGHGSEVIFTLKK